MDYKAISCLRPLKNNSEFRIWNERLVSALDQARPGAKQLIDDQIKKLDKGKNYCTEDEWNADVQVPDPSKSELNYRKFGSDLHYVLMDKCEDTEGIARIRASSGDGINAYFSMYSWFLGRSGQELQNKSSFVMSPTIAKTEIEIAGIIDKWREQYKFMRDFDENWKLPTPFVRAVLRSIMIGSAREYWERLQDE